ncbi:MAG: c-type cytochrome [Anaerolineales bacterium]
MPKFLLMSLLLLALAACGPEEPDIAYDDLPPGDPVRGAALYNQSAGELPSCLSCHATNANRGAGPGLAGIARTAERRDDDHSPGEYIYLSIVQPSRLIVDGYSNSMPSYADAYSAQELADLVAFLLEL